MEGEHSRGREIDVVALVLTSQEDTNVYPLDVGLVNTDLIISPSDPVSIVGFPCVPVSSMPPPRTEKTKAKTGVLSMAWWRSQLMGEKVGLRL